MSILQVQGLRYSSFVAAIFVASAAAPDYIRAQDTLIPSGRLVFRSSSLEFRPEGTFVVHSVLEGIGEVRATGTWKYQSGAIELAAHDVVAGAELLKGVSIPFDGCGTAGQYRFEVNGKQLRLSVIGDACAPRRMFLDKTRWAPPGEPNLAPPRTVTRTMFNAAVRLPRAGDRSGNWPSFRGPQAAWSVRGRGSFTTTPLAYRGLVYVLANNGILDAYEVQTGAEVYRARVPEIGSGFSASPVAADGKIYLSNEDGAVAVVAADRTFRHVATNDIGEPIMATPALSCSSAR